MLDELRIRRLGVIDDALLEFGPGLTVVTGETGAGKTMVVTGLLLLFGGRADPSRVRTGADQATVDGRVRVPAQSAVAGRVRDAGGELDDLATGSAGEQAELVLRRVVAASGRSRAHVGGAGAPVAVLAELGESLLAVHGQSDQLRLARPANQRTALDAYAGTDLGPYRAAFTAWRAAADTLADRLGRTAELRREAAVLARGVTEIEAAAPQPGEDDDLTRLASRLGHADALTAVARAAHDALVGAADDPIGSGTDVSALVAATARAAGQQRGADTDLDALTARLGELGVLAADLGADFGAYADGLDADPERLEQIESRRAVLAALVRTYCDELQPSVAGVLRWADAARTRLGDIDVSDEAIDLLRKAAADAAAAAADQAATVSATRRAAAQRLADGVTAELHGLAMPGSRFTAEVAARPPTSGAPVLRVDGVDAAAGPDGCDDVTFLLQPHPGSPGLPLGRGASGGELSRVMLAVEVCLAHSAQPASVAANEPHQDSAATDTGPQPVPTLVFDEVDAGVGGRAAVEVGRRLARLARDRQVVVVTHLAQVAAFADRHIVVDKAVGEKALGSTADQPVDGIVASDVRAVTGADRLAELARMLAGSDSATARKHAAELLADAQASGSADEPPKAASARARR